jgi:hypothetical protein
MRSLTADERKEAETAIDSFGNLIDQSFPVAAAVEYPINGDALAVIWNAMVTRRPKPITRRPGRKSSRRVPRSGKVSKLRQ